MKNKHMLFSTVSCMIIFSFEVGAQCVMSQDCTTLGYTKTEAECSGNNGVKCPFGNKWYCPNTCDISSFPYTCTGANESPLGGKCGDKYSSCNCATGFSWKDDGCKLQCQIGWIYYSDNTCSLDKIAGKTALGVVVYVTDEGSHGQVMTAKSLDKLKWSTENVDIPSLPNYTPQASAATDFNSCTNTDKIMAQGGSSIYPPAWAARSYAPTTETKGKWCLPAAGIMTSIYNNLDAVQAGISKLGGTSFASFTWSSSEANTNLSWGSYLGHSYGLYNLNGTYKSNDFYVRPVLEF